MEPAKTPTAPPLSEAALPDISSSASGPEKGMLPNDKGMVSQSAPPAGPNQYELGNLTGVFLRSDDPHVQQQSQLMRQDKEMVLPSAPPAEPNQCESGNLTTVSLRPDDPNKQQLNQLMLQQVLSFAPCADEETTQLGLPSVSQQKQNQPSPDKGMVLPSAASAEPNQYEPGYWTVVSLRPDDPHKQQQSQLMLQDKEMELPAAQLPQYYSKFCPQYGVSPVLLQQQNQMFPESGKRHQQGDRVSQASVSKSMAPRHEQREKTKFGETEPFDFQANELGMLKPEVSESKKKEGKLDGKKQQNKFCTSIGWISIEDVFKQINGNNLLSKSTIEVCTNILQKQFPNKINGLSEPVKKLSTLILSPTIKEIPRAQVLFDNEHWTLTWSIKQNEAYFINSDIDPLQLRQLSQNLKNLIILAHKVPNPGLLKVYFSNVQQQDKNSNDCGVFVIAFLVEFFFSTEIGTPETIEFDKSKMRSHLAECLKKGEFSPFPKMIERDHKTKADFLGNLSHIIIL